MPSPPKFLYFDMGKVLLHFSHERGCEQMAKVAGITAAEVSSILFEGGMLEELERGALSDTEFYERFCQQSGTQPPMADLEEAGSAIFWPAVRTTGLIAALRSAGYRLGLFSNTSAAHWRYVQGRYSLLDLFHVQTKSFEIHASKPDLASYTKAAELAGVAGHEIFFTDDRQENIAGALEAGWDAVLFESADQIAEALRQRGLYFG